MSTAILLLLRQTMTHLLSPVSYTLLIIKAKLLFVFVFVFIQYHVACAPVCLIEKSNWRKLLAKAIVRTPVIPCSFLYEDKKYGAEYRLA